MIKIDFTSGFQAIQTAGVQYRFAFAFLKDEHAAKIQLAAANIISEFTDTNPEGMHTTFIRDGGTGEIYALAQRFDSPYNQPALVTFPEGKEYFLRQFPDWVIVEREDAEKYNLQFIDNIGGWLPQYWGIITKCFKNPLRQKTKKSIPFVWAFDNYILKFNWKSGIFTLSKMIHGEPELVSVCRFTENEIFKNPK
jgi:hypothetical protein